MPTTPIVVFQSKCVLVGPSLQWILILVWVTILELHVARTYYQHHPFFYQASYIMFFDVHTN